MNRTRSYRVYGLTVRTSLPLRAVRVEGVPADIAVIIDKTSHDSGTADRSDARWNRTSDGALLRYEYPGGRRLELAYSPAGDRIVVRYTPREDLANIPSVLLGPGIAAALHLRGARMLHAAAVVAGGGAVLLLGAGGAGKSTATTALCRAGAALLTDDVAVIDAVDGRLMVRPGHPQLGLCADALPLLGQTPHLPRVLPSNGGEKRALDARRLSGGFARSSAPLTAVYVLRKRIRGRLPSITLSTPQRAVLPLLQSVYGRDWLAIPTDDVLAWSAALANAVPVFDAAFPEGLDRLPAAAAALLNHATALS